MTKCKNCETELTFMEEAKCLRCLSCHPVTEHVPVEKKETNYVDIPWTAERIWDVVEAKVEEMIREELENWHSNVQEIDELSLARVEPRQPDNPPKDWRAQAKELGIKLFQRSKVDVLAEIEEKTKSPQEGDDNEGS